MGLMGQAFIKNLVKAQIHVQGFDTDQEGVMPNLKTSVVPH